MFLYFFVLVQYTKVSVLLSALSVHHLQVFTLAESLGGYESLAEHPGIMTHASVPEDQRQSLGISDTLIRLSVGLETVEDLLMDLDDALRGAVLHSDPKVPRVNDLERISITG